MPQPALIILQENSGRVDLPDDTPTSVCDQIYYLIDHLTETFEDLKSSLQAAGRYRRVSLLTDDLCRADKFLEALISNVKGNYETDVVFLGHGCNDSISLKYGTLTGGENGTLRGLLKSAQNQGVASLGLRMVFSCSCFGSTLNDDWIQIGAQVAVGSVGNDYMPEPMTTFFLKNIFAREPVVWAADDAYNRTIPLYKPIFPDRPEPRYREVQVPDPRYPGRMMTKRIPDGVNMIVDNRILSSRLITSGMAATRVLNF